MSVEIASASLLPVVDLRQIEAPHDGLSLPINESCLRNFARSPTCRAHYESLAQSLLADGLDREARCPFGFSTYAFALGSERLAFTGYLPPGKSGDKAEKILAKKHPQARVSASATNASLAALGRVNTRLQQLERATIESHAKALHEIRKLNKIVKQTAERLCRAHGSLENAPADLVKILKTSELMSQQYDVIELLANDSLLGLTPSSDVDPYKMLDKCVRIYRDSDFVVQLSEKRFSVRTVGSRPRIRVCEKTFQIIPTTLIENAKKYSLAGRETYVLFEEYTDRYRLLVSNYAPEDTVLDGAVFQKGVRRNASIEGSGVGLYLAQLVANQHGTEIKVETSPAQRAVFVTFSFSLKFST